MKAAVLTGFGANDCVDVRDIDEPAMRPGCLRVQVCAAGVNPLDYKTRRGDVRRISTLRPPFVLGNELAGRVVEVADDVTGFGPGDEIYARVEKGSLGAFAEVAVVAAACAAHKPKRLSMTEAAGVPLAALTALQCLDELGAAKASRLLVHAGAGGVGSFAVQLAHRRGAHVVTTCSTRNLELVAELGADEAIDYTQQAFEQEVSELDGVLDAVGGDTLMRSFGVVRAGGTVVSIAGPPTPQAARENRWGLVVRMALWFMSYRARAAARRHGARYRYLFMRPDGDQLAEIARAIDDGDVKVVTDRVLPLDDVRAAFDHLETGHARGKVVLAVTD